MINYYIPPHDEDPALDRCGRYDPADNARESYNLAIRAMREKYLAEQQPDELLMIDEEIRLFPDPGHTHTYTEILARDATIDPWCNGQYALAAIVWGLILMLTYTLGVSI